MGKVAEINHDLNPNTKMISYSALNSSEDGVLLAFVTKEDTKILMNFEKIIFKKIHKITFMGFIELDEELERFKIASNSDGTIVFAGVSSKNRLVTGQIGGDENHLVLKKIKKFEKI